MRWTATGFGRAVGLALALGALQACDSDDGGDSGDGCESMPLAEACDSPSACPRSKEDAIGAICESPQGSDYWQEGRNGCGGSTVESVGGAIEYVSFDFDAAGMLVGLTRWSDVLEQCDRVYGTPCEQAGGEFDTMKCPASPESD